MAGILEDVDTDLTPQMRTLLSMLWDEWKLLEKQIKALDLDWNGSVPRMPDVRGYVRSQESDQWSPPPSSLPLETAPLSAGAETLLHGWVSCHASIQQGGKAKLLGISKRGNPYLRKILIHGARAAVLRIKRDRALIGPWLDGLDARAPKNVVVVAMANKLARIAWAVLSSGEDYRPMGNTATT
jgi:hypothetical protein